MEKVRFPCEIAGQKCFITTDVVKSDIPLLLNKSVIKEPKMKLQVYVPQNIRKIYFLHKISRTRF